MTKTIGKYLLAIGAVAAVGFGVLFFIQYLRNAEDPEKQAQEYVEALEKAYREDQYGGNTPEETLQLFIDALKKGNTDLAAKYFIIDEQEKWKVKLSDIQRRDVLNFPFVLFVFCQNHLNQNYFLLISKGKKYPI